MSAGTAGGEAARFSLTLPRAADRCEIVVEHGVLAELPALLARHAPAHRYAIISDDIVAGLHGDRVVADLSRAGLAARLFRFPAGEASKSTSEWSRLVEAIAADGLGRDGCVVALGGGVTGDLAGFVAATYARGVPLVQVPTTLLAMVDASIGGKTGLDLVAGKNLAGAFHQPRLIVSDPAVLETLPDAELRGGLAEVVKHGAIADPDGFAWLEEEADAVLRRSPAALRRLVVDSVRVKTRFVAEDVHESGARALLNFGHTIAHAIERLGGYRTSHGAAVATGMVAEARIGEAAGITEAGMAERLARLLGRLGLPVQLPREHRPRDLVAATATDKKAREGAVRYALIRRIGEPARGADGEWTHAVSPALISAVLERP